MAPVGNEYSTLAIELHKTVAKWVSAKSQVFETRNRQEARISSSHCQRPHKEKGSEALDKPN